MSNFYLKPPKLTLGEIHDRADEFRSEYWDGKVPVDIETIMEFDLELPPRPIHGLREEHDVDALLLGNGEIIVDYKLYMEKKMANRLRVSFAHEIGHYVLHRSIIENFKFDTPDEWIEIFHNLPSDKFQIFESQAFEFACRLLVPPDVLEKKLKAAKTKVIKTGLIDWDEWGWCAKDSIAVDVGGYFGVSDSVINIRIEREKLEGLFRE
ncbi:MAG: ImmA/IrrE family metallo-endopeptidase [Kiritimatiellaeota bacterium]|nr:ImmA/IrrE family metallo-endopeptidase [Kiritimatiellota bacterium]